MKIAIFIEPSSKDLKSISKWKNLIKENFGDQTYLDHPAHSTLALFNLKKKIDKSFFEKFKNKISLLKKFNIIISKPNIFYNDPISKGDTLHYSIKTNKKLINLQMIILNLFKKIEKNILKDQVYDNSKFNKNYKKYGFPFVGKDWIPHFTIASIKSNTENKEKFIKKFLIDKILYKSFEVKFISIWLITSNTHKKIFDYHLK
jgi:2'-5' RNA ligase